MGKRRSARICALEASKAHQVAGGPEGEDKYIDKGKQIEVVGQGLNTVQQLPGRKKGRKKRKLRLVEEVVGNSVAVEQKPAIVKKDQPSDPVQPSSSPSTSLKLDKRAYEIIIEILEKRDKLKVFAQPVDPKVVKNYYEFIKEPMDFGTIKTKIQDGKYTTLKEFERDITLVYSNAMHFNGSNSFYGKLGFAIYQLSTKLFNAVKADPANFEAVLSNLRPRPGRRPGSHSTNEIPNGLKDDVAPTGRRSAFSEEESRRTYRPRNEFRSHNESIASMVYESSKQLVKGNSSIGYTESLMRYMKNMGPEVEKIVRRKLIPPVHSPNIQIGSPSTQQRQYPVHGSNFQIGSPSTQQRQYPVHGPNFQIGSTSTQERQYPVHGPNFQIGSPSTQERPNPPNSIINIPMSQNSINNFSGPRTVSNPPRSVINIPLSQTTHNSFPVLPTVPYTPERVINVSTSQNFVRNFSGIPTALTNTGQLDSHSAFRGETSHQIHSSEISMGSSFPITSAGHLNFHANGLANSGTGYFSPVNPENRQISRPGPSYRVNPVPRWNQQTPALQSSGGEQHGPRVAPLRTYSSTALLDQVMAWNRPTAESSALGGMNLPMAAPAPSAAVNPVEANPVLEWNQASLGSPSFAAGNQEMGAPGLAFGTQATQVSLVPNWNQNNLGSQFLGVGNQCFDPSGVNYGIDLPRGGSAPVPVPVPIPVLEWNQQRAMSQQNDIDMSNLQTRLSDMTSFDQNGVSEPEPQLAPVPEAVLAGQMGFCGRGPTGNGANQTELSNLALMANLQHPDLALQL